MSDFSANTTASSADKRCPECGGIMEFNPSKRVLKCPYCDHEEQLKMERASDKVDEAASNNNRRQRNRGNLEQDFASIDDLVSEADWGVETKTVECPSCGAQTIFDSNKTSVTCPYCGSTQVVETKNKNTISPTGVLIFKLDAKQASAKFQEWINGKFFCDADVKANAKPDKMQGLYVPYWTFDATASAEYTGEYGITKRLSDGKSETNWFGTDGFIEEDFDDILVPGTNQQNRNLLRGIEPFSNTNDPLAYKPEYMSGFAAESYTVGPKDAWAEAQNLIKDQLEDKIIRKIKSRNDANDTRNIDFNPEYEDITYKYLLLPVWISSFKYGDKVYNFMVNGQTGKVSGGYPFSVKKFMMVLAIAAVVIGLLFFLMGSKQ